ncbi:MAG: hypothetical protein JRF61_10460 [Deltaproteobacteria bacterium]|jgi:hypothetical protein|nr:hypothetical protein [Deltaproteobacteria bacterium]
MSKLWIVHRNAQRRAALARLAGLDAREVVTGAPREADFEHASLPAAVLIGLEEDFELELDFVDRLRTRLADRSWILLTPAADAQEARRLFAAVEPRILEPRPTARVLRAHIAAALARRTAESLASRRKRSHVAERFSAWLSGIEIPGVLRALDPSLGSLPLLVRGVPGSGRALLCHYVELFRGVEGPSLRLHGADITGVEDLARRIATLDARTGASVWIDEVDQLPASAQNALAEWILHGLPPAASGAEAPRWIATAGPPAWQDRLEPALRLAFAPLQIEVPSLGEHPELLSGFAQQVARDWARTVGGPPRRFAPDALEALRSQLWEGDRAEIEAVLRATLAATTADPIEASDLLLAAELFGEPSEISGESRDESGEQAEAVEAEGIAAPARDEVEVPTEPELVAEVVALDPSEVDERTLLSEASFVLAQDEDESPAAVGRQGGVSTEGPGEMPSPEPIEPQADAATEPSASDRQWRRLARSLSHEIRNPLVSIRTFAELLPEHYEDETFRERFSELVGQDVAHIGDILSRLASVVEHEKLEAQAFDVSSVIEELLEERRERIQERRLLVLRELEREAPVAWADPSALRAALAGLLDRALDSLPERGDLFIATRHIERAADGEPRLRILIRHHSRELAGGGEERLEELTPASNVLEYVIAQTVVEASGGSLTIDSTDAHETLILVDLRTPS